MYEENDRFQKHPGWPHILSNLTLGDLEAFGQAHWKLQTLLNAYLEKPAKIVVDQETIWKYPLDLNKDMYDKYHKATMIEFNGVLDQHLKRLIFRFPNMTELTLRNMRITFYKYMDEDSPLFLRKLTLIKNTFRGGFMQYFSVSSLHMEGNDDRCMLSKCPSLESLTLIQQKVHLSNFECPLLTTLTIDYCWNDIKYDKVAQLPALQELRVLRSVDWKTMSQIEALQLRSVQVQHYFQVPADNNLLLKLNDDCLYHLQRFLPVVDWMCLYESHPRFQHLRILSLEVNEQTLNRFPSNHSIYKRIGPLVIRLKMDEIREEDYWTLLPHFTNLGILDLSYIGWLPDRILTCIPMGLKELFLMTLNIAHDNELRDLLKRLNPTLRVLRLDHGEFDEFSPISECLEELHHLKKLSCYYFEVTPGLLNCLRQNKDHLTKLELGIPELSTEVWSLITEMPQLTYLGLFVNTLDVGIPETHVRALATLQHLELKLHRNAGMKDLVLSLDTSNLKTFSYTGPEFAYGSALWSRMTNLVELHLDYDNILNPMNDLVPDIFPLTMLKKIMLRSLEDSQVLPLIKGLPQLTHLIAVIREMGDNAVLEVEQYFRLTQRRVEIIKFISL